MIYASGEEPMRWDLVEDAFGNRWGVNAVLADSVLLAGDDGMRTREMKPIQLRLVRRIGPCLK